MTSPVMAQARIVAELRERLKAEHGLDDGDEVLEDTLEGASDLPEMLAALCRRAARDEEFAEAVKRIIKDNQERAARFVCRAVAARAEIAWAMQEAGIKKIPSDALPDMTVTLRDGVPAIRIENEELVPDAYCTIEIVRKPDKAKIREALEAGELIAGAALGNAAPVLMMRRK